MSDEKNAQPQEGEQQDGEQQKQIQLRDMGKETQYANFFTVTGGMDALLLSFGAQFGRADVAQIESKLAISWRNAKRLAMSLGSVIRRYEQERGEIDLGVNQGQSGG